MVDFIFIGPDKSGSSWLDLQLRHHPGVALPKSKELFYFDRYYSRGQVWYESNFDNSDSLVRGELSHDYLFSPTALERIAQDYPNVRLLTCLREPYDRARSAMAYMKYQGRIHRDLPFTEALEEFPELIDHGLYGKHLTCVFEHFNTENVHLLLFDDLRRDPVDFFESTCTFLGIDFVHPHSTDKVLAATVARSQLLNRVLRHLGWRLRDWGLESVVGSIKRSALPRLLGTAHSDKEDRIPDERRSLNSYTLVEADVILASRLTGQPLNRLWGYA